MISFLLGALLGLLAGAAAGGGFATWLLRREARFLWEHEMRDILEAVRGARHEQAAERRRERWSRRHG